MASPQKENGYTAIANEILDAVALLKINGTQFRILLVVWRYTYGFQRKSHSLSESYISKATGIHIKQVGRELQGLIKRNIITEISQPTFSQARTIAFNKNHFNWESTKQLTGSGIATTTGSGLVDPTGSGLVDQERNIKENLKKGKVAKSKIDFKQYALSQNVVDVLAEFVEHRKQMKKPTTQLAVTKIVNMFVQNKYNDEEMILSLEKSIMNGYQGVFPLKDNERIYKEVEKSREPEPQFESEEQRIAQNEFVANLLRGQKPAIDLERMLE